MSSKETVNEKIESLKDMIIEHAGSKRTSIIDAGRREAEAWIQDEMDALEKETEAIVRDAQERADDLSRRRILSAERERATEKLRLQSSLLKDAQRRFREALAHLRDREGYEEILASLATIASREMPAGSELVMSLARSDAALGERVVAAASERSGRAVRFAPDGPDISGGACVATADGRRMVYCDWQTVSEESTDKLASRLLEFF